MTQLRVSASQIGVWKDCQRRWGYEYLDGIKPPANASAELGSKVHGYLEQYLKVGVRPDTSKAGRIASRALDFAETLRARGAKVEHKFDFNFGNVVYGGFVDAHHYEDGELLIVDWKTSSDPEKWGLDDNTLASNTQAVIYAMWGVTEYPVDRVHLHWHYLHTRAAVEAKPAQAVLSKAEIASKFAELAHAPALEINAGRKKAALDLPQNFASCGKFGGCPHIERCHGTATPQERLRSLMSQALRAPGHIPKALTTPDKEQGSRMSLLAMLEDEENTTSKPAEPEAPANEAENPPEEAPTQAGADAQAAAYEAAGQRLPPKRGRGRPRGAKNKPKEAPAEPATAASKPDDLEKECAAALAESSKWAVKEFTPTRDPLADLKLAARKRCLEMIVREVDGTKAKSWADALNCIF